jgi:putative acetyltransferase
MYLQIRKATPQDVDPIRFLFRDTVLFVNSKDYNKEEIRVWSNGYLRIASWQNHIHEQYFLVAVLDYEVVGFSSLTDTGYLDFLYVHKDHQGEGIASALLSKIQDHAAQLSLKEIYSHVSRTAQPFFERKGFTKRGEHTKIVDAIEFTNTVMAKPVHEPIWLDI